MKLFTVTPSQVEPGAQAVEFVVGGTTTIMALLVGEEGRGRSLGVLPVEGLTPIIVPHMGDRKVADFKFATITASRSGRPKLRAVSSDNDDTTAIVILLMQYGFRGEAYLTGKFTGMDEKGREIFAPFPGTTLVVGTVADGEAGRMASAEQVIATIPSGMVFRIHRTGRLYGEPSTRYYIFCGGELLTVTEEERSALPDGHPLAWPGGPDD